MNQLSYGKHFQRLFEQGFIRIAEQTIILFSRKCSVFHARWRTIY